MYRRARVAPVHRRQHDEQDCDCDCGQDQEAELARPVLHHLPGENAVRSGRGRFGTEPSTTVAGAGVCGISFVGSPRSIETATGGDVPTFPSRAATISAAVWKRRAGSFTIAPSMAARMPTSRSGQRSASGVGSVVANCVRDCDRRVALERLFGR